MNTYGYVGGNPVGNIDPLGLYMPQNTENCWVNILSKSGFKQTDKTHTLWGKQNSFDVTIPMGGSTGYHEIWKARFYSQEYWKWGQFESTTSYVYVCKEKDKCGNDTFDELPGWHDEEIWKLIDSGTNKWWDPIQMITNPTPGPWPDQSFLGGPPPLAPPILLPIP